LGELEVTRVNGTKGTAKVIPHITTEDRTGRIYGAVGAAVGDDA